MLFNSYEFIFFFLPLTWLTYLLTLRAGRYQAARTALLFASLFFYGWWNPQYVVLIAGSVLFNFLVGRGLEDPSSGPLLRRLLVIAGVSANLVLLGYFKYTAFAVTNVNVIAGTDFIVPSIILPLAISFHTFQQIAYLVDSYRGQMHGYSLLQYSLFVTFFPQMMAGPIVHHNEVIPEFERVRREGVTSAEVSIGICFFIVGLFKKVVIADNIALHSSPVFAAADAGSAISPETAWIGVLAYTLQLYFDFSGYCDMAIGSARMFGIRLPYNFNSPYKSLSITEFWRRWHMTLSRFLRDYLYVPLGGNRRGPFHRQVNLMITMLLGGLWHGAGWNFVVWGALHGFALVVNHWWRDVRGKANSRNDSGLAAVLGRFASWALTMSVVVVGWALFRSTSFGGATRMLTGMSGMEPADSVLAFRTAETGIAWIVIAAGFAIALFAPNSQQLLDLQAPGRNAIAPAIRINLTMSGRTAIAFGLLFFTCLAGMSDVSEFLYFQF